MALAACCQDPANLGPPEPTGAPNETMRRCGVCQRRHFRVSVDPGRLGLVPSGPPAAPALVTEEE